MAEEKIILPEDDDWLEDFQEESATPEEPPAEGLEQSDIDNLLEGGDEGPAMAVNEQTPEDEGIPSVDLDSLDQNQVDDLLGTIEEEEETPTPTAPDQEEIDQLFDKASKEEDEKEVAAAPAPQNADNDAFDLDFDSIEADDFGFDEEIVEIPDETSVEAAPAVQEIQEILEKPGKKASKRMVPIFTKKNLAIAASVVFLLGVGTFGYMMLAGKKKAAITLPPPPPVQVVKQKKTPPPPPPNTMPEALAAQYKLRQPDSEVVIKLEGKDADGDPLTYALSRNPRYGKLAGELPGITYIPDRNFPGRDAFEFTVSDGKGESPPATVIITGPNMVKLQAKAPARKQRRVSAVNVTMKTLSTDDLVINWKKIWRQSNHASFNSKVRVKIEKQPEHGKLTRLSETIYHYQPEVLFSGEDIIRYRFEKSGHESRTRRVRMLVELGDRPPQINLQPLAKTVFSPGETVLLDASASTDENREALDFSWMQMSGVPVIFKKRNREGSIVSFIVPSSFYRGDDGVNLRVRITVVDPTDQLTSKDIEITARSSRQAALWRGMKNGELAPEPLCPQGECPGQYLPWPYLK